MLFVAIIVLIIMTLSGLALLRQMSGSNAISGNVAFKVNATSTADAGAEKARQWVLNPVNNKNNSSAADGYYATWVGGIDPAQYDWENHSGTSTLDDGTGNKVRYIINRLCETEGLDPNNPAQRCSDVTQQSGASHSGAGYGGSSAPPPPIPFFRITTRVDGPRNTISYTQILLY
ncbi:MAG: pilus assembly PilX N-terminal domain-containing protein [Caldimonas sp.]